MNEVVVTKKSRRGILSDVLHRLCRRGQYGHPRTPSGIYLSDSYCEYYHTWLWTVEEFAEAHGLVPNGADTATRGKAAFALYQRVVKLWQRYQRLHHYLTEVKPGWKEINRIHYADNSIYVKEQAADGQTRTRMVRTPGGDACF